MVDVTETCNVMTKCRVCFAGSGEKVGFAVSIALHSAVMGGIQTGASPFTKQLLGLPSGSIS